MATRSNIAIVLRPEDLNRPLNFVDHIVEHQIDSAMIECSNAREQKSVILDLRSIFTDVRSTEENPVLQIYSHWDGYPEGVGVELLKSFNTYEKALALVLAGDTSGVYDGATHVYSLGKDEEYDGKWGCRPDALPKPDCQQEYLYTFADGEWKLGNKMISLSEYLDNPDNFYND